jgi:hypothetical protein
MNIRRGGIKTSKITSQQIKQDFEEIVGWTYVSPGTNDINGIDCSGAWVRCYKKHGYNILHGSNSIYRKECSSAGQINSDGDLKVGMMVFKNRFDGKEPEKYKNDGLGNFYHIGAVTSINPLVITHATSPNAKQDTKFNSNRNGWTHWGIGNKVEISDVVINDGTNGGNETVATSGELQDKNCKVVTENKSSVNMRKEDNKKGALVVRVPDGETVLVTSDSGNSYVGVRWEDVAGAYKNIGKVYTGYMAREFLTIYDENSTDADSEDSNNVDVIVIDEKSDLEKRIYNATVATNASVEYAETLKKCAFELFPEFADK